MDEFKARLKKSWRGALTGGLICALVGWSLVSIVGERFAHWSYDLPMAARGTIRPDQAVMIYMDEESHKVLDQPYTAPWDRQLHAELLKRLTRERPAGVVFDIVFSDPGPNPKTDEEFAKAIKENGNVILAADSKGDTDLGEKEEFFPPYNLFYDACDGRCGSTAFNPDSDIVTRLEQPAQETDAVFGSEAWEAAKLLKAPITFSDLNKTNRYGINYYGPKGTIPSVSFYQVVQDDPSIPTNFFTGKMVFVGANIFTVLSGGRKDSYPTPFSFWYKQTFTSGVEIEATSFLNLLRGDYLFRLPENLEKALMIVFGFIAGFSLRLLRPLAACLTALAFAAAAFLLDYWLFIHLHRWFAWMIMLVAQIPLALIWSVVFNSVQLYVERRLFEQTLGLYLSHKLVKKFANNPKMRQPGAQKQLLTILFTDIANFTSISEGMDPDDLARLMNQYFQGAVQNCIFPMEGTVVKYIGDAIFAFWNAPDPQADHAFRACQAALSLRQQDKFSANGQPLLTRLGLHSGEANVGNFGSEARFDYTALGENINLASRMEGLNKYMGTRILLTQETKNDIDGRLVTRYLGLFRLKGFEKAVGVYELVSRIDQDGETKELRARFAEALEKFVKRDFDGAEAAFKRVLGLRADDGPSKFYLEHLEEFRTGELPAEWKGEVTLKEK